MLPQKQNRFHRFGIFSGLALLLFSIVTVFLFTEVVLRLQGEIPGYIPRYKNFKLVKQLEVKNNFFTDNEGIFKANRNNDKGGNSYHINIDGFRSIEFKKYEKHEKTKILFLGDSFAWGASARPITNSFVDRISRQGYLTFNTGIPGTDPNQYAYIAEKYVPLLHPDIVAVIFYMGNDLIPPRPMLPHKNLHHITNAGWLYAFDKHENYLSPHEAYNYYLAKNNFLTNPSENTTSSIATIRQVFMSSVVSTYIWAGILKISSHFSDSIPQQQSNSKKSIKNQKKIHHTKVSLNRIKSVSEKYNAKFMLFLIQVCPGQETSRNSIEHNLYILKDFKPVIPDFLTEQDYVKPPNGHFNNSGHQKYAEFVLKNLTH